MAFHDSMDPFADLLAQHIVKNLRKQGYASPNTEGSVLLRAELTSLHEEVAQ